MRELTNSIRKLVYSLGEAKHRHSEKMFKAEGTKCVLDTIDHFPLRYLLVTDAWLTKYARQTNGIAPDYIIKATNRDMERMSSLATAPEVIAVYDIPHRDITLPGAADNNIVVALDTIQDPGNLGTIIRVADWMGVELIICSSQTADIYSPKVVQATMGAISRVQVIYGDLSEMIATINPPVVYGTFLDGENINTAILTNCGIVITGNEGRGISDRISNLVTRRLTIPSYPPERPTSESLNAAVATAITLAAFRRNA